MDDPQGGVAITNGLHQDAHPDEVVDVREVPTAHNHLLINGIQVLGPPGDGDLEPSRANVRLKFRDDPGEVLITRRRPLGYQSLDLLEDFGIEGGEGQILQLPFHRVHTEPMGQRSINLERLARLLLLLLGRHKAQGAHVVQAIGEFDDQHANVARHSHHHLAHGLSRRGFAVGDPVQLGHAIDKVCHLVAKVLPQLVQGVAGVLHGVVEQGSTEGWHRHAQLGKDGGHRQRMGDVGVTGATLLIPVEIRGRLVGALQGAHIRFGVVLTQRTQERLHLRWA